MAEPPEYKIIEASPEWAAKYRALYQQTVQAAYPRPELGITRDLFTPEMLFSPRLVEHFKQICRVTDTNKSWLAVDHAGELLGGVVARNTPDYCEMRTFYVRPDQHGRGIGHALYGRVLAFAGSRAILADVIEYMEDTINMYKHWGFHVDESRGKKTYPWDNWPPAPRSAMKGIYMIKPAGDDLRGISQSFL